MAPRTRMIRLLLGALISALAGPLAHAAGPLKDLRWPVVGRPAVGVPGGQFEVGLRGESTLLLEGGGLRQPLAVTWSGESGGVRTGHGAIPESLAPGVYDLIAQGPSGGETQRGVVHILASTPETYAFAIVHGNPASAAPEGPGLPEGTFEQLSGSGVQFAFVLLPPAAPINAAACEALQSMIEQARLPVFICAGERDLDSDTFAAYFGAPVYGAQFGADAFLMLGSALAAQEPSVKRWLGEAHRIRRAQRASRWSTGVTSRYGLDWDIRSQIALFADDPLDFLVAGEVPVGMIATVPWGSTVFVPRPGETTGAVRVVDVSSSGMVPRTDAAPSE